MHDGCNKRGADMQSSFSLRRRTMLAYPMAAALLGPSRIAAAVSTTVVNIRVGIGLPESHPQGQAVLKFAELVKQRSGGNLAVTLHADGSLGNDVSMISDLQAGRLEMAVPDTATLVSQVKGFGIVNFPFLFASEAEADALLDGSFGDKLLGSLPAKGLIGLGFWENGFRNITNNRRPVARIEDMRGTRIRVMQSPMFIDTFKAMGADAQPMPFTELYGALADNRIDGQENPLATILGAKFNHVQKYLTMSRHTYSVWILLMSRKLWDMLSPRHQAIIREAAREAKTFERALIRADNEVILQELRKSGMTVTEVSSIERSRLRMITRPVIEKYKKEFGREWVDALYFAMASVELKRFK
jgi:tripartite ATP-independent transporter DctP family solute receptor